LAVLGEPVPIWSLQTYLTQQDLPGNPCTSSAWTHMRAVGSNRCRTPVGQMIIFGKDPAGGNKLVS
jgi:hypothetical protein